MNIDCNYDDEKCNTLDLECCDNDIVYKIQRNKETVNYIENIIIDLNEADEITISGLTSGDKIIFLNGKSGVGSNVIVFGKTFTLNSNYNGISVYYENNLIFL